MSYSPLTPLEDRVAVVTGGARGIGFESAKALKENGAKVVIVDINAEAGEKAAKDLGVDFVETDLTRSDAVTKLAGDIRSKHGRIEVRDRAALERLAGVSYGLPEAEYRRLIGSS